MVFFLVFFFWREDCRFIFNKKQRDANVISVCWWIRTSEMALLIIVHLTYTCLIILIYRISNYEFFYKKIKIKLNKINFNRFNKNKFLWEKIIDQNLWYLYNFATTLKNLLEIQRGQCFHLDFSKFLVCSPKTGGPTSVNIGGRDFGYILEFFFERLFVCKCFCVPAILGGLMSGRCGSVKTSTPKNFSRQPTVRVIWNFFLHKFGLWGLKLVTFWSFGILI